MASRETQGSTTSIDQPPLWDYVTKLEKLVGAEGCWKFKCNLCSETRQGSYSRVRAHLLGIKGNHCSVLNFNISIYVVEFKKRIVFYSSF